MNPVQAYFWWTLAARQGNDEARALLARATPRRAPEAGEHTEELLLERGLIEKR